MLWVDWRLLVAELHWRRLLLLLRLLLRRRRLRP
jgi:hypothetical protein